MLRNEFEKKYKTEIALMAKAQDVDMGVASAMLIAHVRNKNIDTPHKYNFEGQESLDYEELEKDIAEMDSLAAEKRAELGL